MIRIDVTTGDYGQGETYVPAGVRLQINRADKLRKHPEGPRTNSDQFLEDPSLAIPYVSVQLIRRTRSFRIARSVRSKFMGSFEDRVQLARRLSATWHFQRGQREYVNKERMDRET